MALARRFDRLNPTRRSLLNRVKNLNDQESWKEFFDTYCKLVYSAACKAGLSHSEAEEAVQETFITLCKTMPGFTYDPAIGSFRNFVIHTARFKIRDQLRKRKYQAPARSSTSTGRRTSTIERIPDPVSLDLDRMCEEEFQTTLFKMALEKVKRKTSSTQYQIFDLYVLKEWPVRRIARALGISGVSVYLAKSRVKLLLSQEIKKLKQQFR